jgi:hypothetical protein
MPPATDDWLELLYYFGPTIPIFLVALAGWIVSLVLWRKHPAVSVLAFLGFTIYLLNVVGGTLLSYLLTRGMLRNANPQDISRALAYLAMARGILSAGALLLFTFAIFGWRSHPRFGYRNSPLSDEAVSK